MHFQTTLFLPRICKLYMCSCCCRSVFPGRAWLSGYVKFMCLDSAPNNNLIRYVSQPVDQPVSSGNWITEAGILPGFSTPCPDIQNQRMSGEKHKIRSSCKRVWWVTKLWNFFSFLSAPRELVKSRVGWLIGEISCTHGIHGHFIWQFTAVYFVGDYQPRPLWAHSSAALLETH